MRGWAGDAKRNAGWIIVLGVVTVIAGFQALVMPWAGGVDVTVFIGFMLMVDGIFGVVLAFQVEPENGWGWMLFSAVMSVIFGFLLIKEWPLTGMWAIGTLVGVNLLFAGLAMISIGSSARKLVTQVV